MSSPFASIYRAWFLYVDPLLSMVGIYIQFATPEFMLSGLNPAYKGPASSEVIHLLDTNAAWLCAIMILQLGLLRAKPTDVTVWKFYAAAVGTVDTLVCVSVLRALRTQNRLGISDWRVEEWMNLVSTAMCAVVRWSFVLGIGVNRDLHGTKKTL